MTLGLTDQPRSDQSADRSMTYSTFLPEPTEVTEAFAPGRCLVEGDPRSQYWIKHGVVFFESSVVQGADSTMFRCFMSGWAFDGRGVYKFGKLVRTLSAATFRCYSFAYHGDACSIRTLFGGVIRDAHVPTFEALDRGFWPIPAGHIPFILQATGYARDRNRVYWCDNGGKGMHVVKADPATFERVNCLFGKDDRHVYSGRTSLPKADPKTWRPIGGYFSADANRVFHVSSIVEGADPETFQVQSTSFGSFHFASDNSAFYSGSRKISRTDYEKGIS